MKKQFAWGAVILLATAGASLVTALPAQVAYCEICAARQDTHAYGFRFAKHPVFQQHSLTATPFSALVQEKKLVPPHQHLWQEPYLAPDPLNEFAPPVLESVAYLNAPRVVTFTRNVADYADPASVTRWRELATRPGYARVLDASLRFLRVPEAGFADRASFLAWWGNNSYAVYNRLREVTEPD